MTAPYRTGSTEANWSERTVDHEAYSHLSGRNVEPGDEPRYGYQRSEDRPGCVPCGVRRDAAGRLLNAGVGTGDLVDRILGGFFGRSLRNNVKRAYAFLSLNYAPGDEIYI